MQKIIIDNRTNRASATLMERVKDALEFYEENKNFGVTAWSDNIYVSGTKNKSSITIHIWERTPCLT